MSEGGGGRGRRGILERVGYLTYFSHFQSSFMANQQQVDSVKAEVVDYAREKWPMFFSRFFKVSAVSGQHSECKQVLSGAQQCPVFGQLVNITCVFTKLLYSFHMTMKRPMKILLTMARNCAVNETLSQYQVLLSCFVPVLIYFLF